MTKENWEESLELFIFDEPKFEKVEILIVF